MTLDRELEGLEVVRLVVEEAVSGSVVEELEVRVWLEGKREEVTELVEVERMEMRELVEVERIEIRELVEVEVEMMEVKPM